MATDTAVDVVMPQMGVSVSEGTVTKWLKAEGDTIAPDEPLLEISTDKVDTEVPSPAGGVLGEILVQEGETVEVGTPIGRIRSGAATAAPAEATGSTEARVEAPPEAPATAAAPEPSTGDGAPARSFVSPVVARIAAEHGVDVSTVSGTGRGGRVTKADILAFIEAGAAPAPAPAVAAAPAGAALPAAAPAEPTPVEAAPGETLERMSVMRRSISEHMRRSLEVSAPVTTVFEIDMSKVVSIRERLKVEYAESHGVRLTYLAFIARATIDAISQWPWI
ncbi:MAG: biotin/lipoyl-containing protein, partial [Gaiellales bacterium]